MSGTSEAWLRRRLGEKKQTPAAPTPREIKGKKYHKVPNETNPPVTMRLEAYLWKELSRVSNESGYTKTRLINLLLKDYLPALAARIKAAP